MHLRDELASRMQYSLSDVSGTRVISCACRLVKEGDTVSMGDALCEVQSDKVLCCIHCIIYIVVVAALQLVASTHVYMYMYDDLCTLLTWTVA